MPVILGFIWAIGSLSIIEKLLVRYDRTKSLWGRFLLGVAIICVSDSAIQFILTLGITLMPGQYRLMALIVLGAITLCFVPVVMLFVSFVIAAQEDLDWEITPAEARLEIRWLYFCAGLLAPNIFLRALLQHSTKDAINYSLIVFSFTLMILAVNYTTLYFAQRAGRLYGEKKT